MFTSGSNLLLESKNETALGLIRMFAPASELGRNGAISNQRVEWRLQAKSLIHPVGLAMPLATCR